MADDIAKVITRLIDEGIKRQALELHQRNIALMVAYTHLVNMMDSRGLLPKDQVLQSLEKTAHHTGNIPGNQAVEAHLQRLLELLRTAPLEPTPEEVRKGFRVISEDPPEPDKGS